MQYKSVAVRRSQQPTMYTHILKLDAMQLYKDILPMHLLPCMIEWIDKESQSRVKSSKCNIDPLKSVSQSTLTLPPF